MARGCIFLVLIAGCATRGSEAAEYDTAGRRDSIAAVAAASMREEHVIGLLARTSAADSAVGSIGAKLGSTRAIKDFGLMVSRESHALVRDALAVGRGLRLEPAAPPTAPDAAPPEMRAALDSMPAGTAWDNAYLALAVASHEASLENFARALAATQSPEIKTWITKSAPIVQKHLDKAKRLQGGGAR